MQFKLPALNRYSVYVLLYHLLFLGFSMSSLIPMQVMLVYLVGVFCIEFRSVSRNVFYTSVFGVLSFFGGICFLFKGFYVNSSLIVYQLFFGIILQFYLERRIGPEIYAFILIIYCSFIYFNIFRGVDPDYILYQRSRNMVSFYALLYTIYYYIEDFRWNKKVNILPALNCSVLALLLVGRSGIIVSLLLLLFVFFYQFSFISTFSKVKRILIITAVSGVFVYTNYQLLMQLYESSFGRFIELGVDMTGREDINQLYLSKMIGDPMALIFGVSLNDPIFERFDFNLHNSFFSAHYFWGIFSLIFFAIILKCFFVKGNIFYKGLFVILLIRGSTDQVFFIDFMDVIIYYLMFLIFNLGNNVDSDRTINDKVVCV